MEETEIKHNLECDGTLRKVIAISGPVRDSERNGTQIVTIWQCRKCKDVESTVGFEGVGRVQM